MHVNAVLTVNELRDEFILNTTHIRHTLNYIYVLINANIFFKIFNLISDVPTTHTPFLLAAQLFFLSVYTKLLSIGHKLLNYV